MAGIAHRFKGRCNLTERYLGHCDIPAPLGNDHQRDSFIAETASPVERNALAGLFLTRLAIGGDGLLELRGPALARTEGLQRVAQIVLGPGHCSGTRSRL